MHSFITKLIGLQAIMCVSYAFRDALNNKYIHTHISIILYRIYFQDDFLFTLSGSTRILCLSCQPQVQHQFPILQRLKDLWRCFQTSIIINNNFRWQQKDSLYHKVIEQHCHYVGDETHCYSRGTAVQLHRHRSIFATTFLTLFPLLQKSDYTPEMLKINRAVR